MSDKPAKAEPNREAAESSRRRFVAKLVKIGTVAIPVAVAASIQSRAHAS